MQTLLWSKKIILISFIQLAISCAVQAEVVNEKIKKKEELLSEIKRLNNIKLLNKDDSPAVMPVLNNAQQGRVSKATTFKPNLTQVKNKYIPVMSDAIIFANYDEDLPAIVNYYTYKSEEEVSNFYQENFTQILNQERKQGRLILTFTNNDKPVTIIISQQDNKQQVDVRMNLALATP